MDSVGEYLVKGIVGEGGMGVVYEGLQPVIGKRVAIKLLKKHAMQDEREAARLIEEARLVNAIGHRGIVDIFSFGQLPDGRQYFVMEYLQGVSLSKHIRQHAPLPVPDVLQILDEMLAALQAAHDQGVVHRDLKPSNVFLVVQGDGSSYVKVLDFGLAKRGLYAQGQVNQTSASHVMGTPEFMAPEQIRAEAVSPRTDLYSLGVLAFEMLTGRLPFVHESIAHLVQAHLEHPAPAPSSLRSNITPDVDKLVMKLMEKDPAQRPRNCEHVRQQIRFIRSEHHFNVATRLAVLPTPDEPVGPKLPSAPSPSWVQPGGVVDFSLPEPPSETTDPLLQMPGPITRTAGRKPTPAKGVIAVPPRAQTPPKGLPTWAQPGAAVELKRPGVDPLVAPPARMQTPPKGLPTWAQPGAAVDLKRPTPDALVEAPVQRPRSSGPKPELTSGEMTPVAPPRGRPSGPKPQLGGNDFATPPAMRPQDRDTDRMPPAPPGGFKTQPPLGSGSFGATMRLPKVTGTSRTEWVIRIGAVAIGALCVVVLQAWPRSPTDGPQPAAPLPRSVIVQAAPLQDKPLEAPVMHRDEPKDEPKDEPELAPLVAVVETPKEKLRAAPLIPPPSKAHGKRIVKGLRFVTPGTSINEAVQKRLKSVRSAWFSSRKGFPEDEAKGFDLALQQCEKFARSTEQLEAMNCLDEFVKLAFDDHEP